jgi:hypothetical protein
MAVYVNQVSDGPDGYSHTPPYVKNTEITTPYNPFFYEVERLRNVIVPQWTEVPGITINWLAQAHQPEMKLFIGIDAATAQGFMEFANKFAVGHNLTAGDAERLVNLGHPTLAHRGPGFPAEGAASLEDIRNYVGNLDNYSGVIGGELNWTEGGWVIDDNSGRYGAHRQLGLANRDRRAALRTMALAGVQRKFLEKAGIEVAIAR